MMLWIKDAAGAILLVIGLAAWAIVMWMLTLPAQADEFYPLETVEVVRVIDGDTMELADGERARLWGIDAPEMGQQHALDAKRHLELITGGVEISCARIDLDRYGRTVVRCVTSVSYIEINEEMVRAGFARDWPNYSNGRYYDLMAEALQACRGVWADYCI